MSNMVKFFHSDMTGAPVLSGLVGALIGVLDTCLLTGFGAQNVSSVVVSGGIATATFGTAFPFELMSAVLVSGATPSGLNGEKKVLSTTGTTITFDATGISDQTATGTISIKLAPLGFSKVFSGTNLAVYTSVSPSFYGGFLRVDDTAIGSARTVAYEGMFDVNTGSNPYPTNTQMSGGLYWSKSNAGDATARKWVLWGDDRLFYLWTAPNTANGGINGQIVAFGDALPKIAGEKYAMLMTGMPGTGYTTTTSLISACLSTSAISLSNGVYLPRPNTGVPGAPVTINQLAQMMGSAGNQTSGLFTGATASLTFPNGPDNGVFLTPVMLLGAGSLRGFLPGFYQVPHNCGSYFSHRDPIQGTDDFVGRRILALKVGPANSAAVPGIVGVDVTGPWR